MERFTISLDDQLAHEFDHLIAERGYSNRSEAVRDILRVHMARLRETQDQDGPCVANLSKSLFKAFLEPRKSLFGMGC